jgi:hypothetical protein
MHPTTAGLLAGDRIAALQREAERSRLAALAPRRARVRPGTSKARPAPSRVPTRPTAWDDVAATCG